MIEIGDKSWKDKLSKEFEKEYYIDLIQYLEAEYRNNTIYPEKEDIFNAFNFSTYSNTKVVILGQDPYHEKGQAHGLAFSVKKGVKIPPSLVNIYNELNNDLNIPIPNHGSLEYWAHQGVLLLNTVLTVREGFANSHKNKGWETFTDEVIKILNNHENPIVFILWGKNAISKKKFITNDKHLILTSPHPSPLSCYRGFFGCKFFSKTNTFLKSNGIKEIDWKIL